MLKPFLLLALLTLFLFSGCLSQNSNKADLKISYSKDGKTLKKEYSCIGKNCQVIENVKWQPISKNKICSEGYGGTDFIKIRGQVNSRNINSTFQKTNACEIDRFNSLRELLRYTGLEKSIINKDQQITVSRLLHLRGASQYLSSNLPFLSVWMSTCIILLLLLVVIYLWIDVLRKLWREQNSFFSFILFIPPVAILYIIYKEVANKKRLRFTSRIMLDASIILGSFFLFFPATIAALSVVLYLEFKEKDKSRDNT